MKINPIMNPNILQSYRAGKALPKDQPQNRGGTDEVSFSDEALNFSKLMSEIKDQIQTSAPEQRARVEELKSAIQNGSYHVDSEKVAERMLKPYPND